MIRGTKRPIVKAVEIIEQKARKIDAQLNATIHNRFDIEVIDVATGEVRQRAQAQNVICNALWTRLLAPNTYFNYIHYGTGTGAPAATDTSLFTFLGYGTPATADDVISTDEETGTVSLRRKIQLSELTAVGSTLTEVGIGYSTTAETLVTHAMLKDMNGNQISIAKTSTDIINVYATVFLHISSALDTARICYCDYNTSYMSLTRALFGRIALNASSAADSVLSYMWANIPPAQAHFYGYPTYIKGTISAAYDATTKRITLTCPRLAASDFNINSAGIIEISMGANTYYYGGANTYAANLKIRVGGDIPASSVSGEAVGTGDGSTQDFATKFPCVSGLSIKVDGAATTSGFTWDDGVPLSPANMGLFFELVPKQSGNPEDSSYRYYSNPTVTGDGRTHTPNGYATYFNPNYAKGISSFNYSEAVASSKVECSNDLITWVELCNGGSAGVKAVPAAYAQYKYFRLTKCATKAWTSANVLATNIHFATPPASGAVITADYTTKTIAKDVNHVFDLTVTIQLGEYTE